MNNYQYSLSDFIIDFKNDLLGKGKYGYVYKAFFKKMNKYVALKMINKDVNDKNQLIKVTREYEIMKKVNNQNLEKIIGSFEGVNPLGNSQCFFFVLEFIEGENLDNLSKRYIHDKKTIDQTLIMRILYGTENGLYYLHKNGIIHRDISPDNIMIDKNNQIIITDFGLSAYYIKHGDVSNNLVYNYTIVGRKLFVGSELIRRMNSGDQSIIYETKNDIFAFGITMYYLMTFGYPPCVEDRVEKNTYKFVPSINPKIYTQNLIRLVMSMIRNDPEQRPDCQTIYLELNKIKLTNSSFCSVINCLVRIEQLIEYLIDNQINKKSPLLYKEEHIFTKVFIDSLQEAKISKTAKSDHLNEFINCFYDKNFIYDISEIIPPRNIIKSIFDYFLTHSLFLYNNKKGNTFSEETKNYAYRKNIFIDNKIKEFVSCYKSIFVELFYFLVLRTYKCQKCSKEIDQDLDIKYCLDLMSIEKDKIYRTGELLKNYFKKNNASNLGNNSRGYSLTCKHCGTVPKILDEYREIVLEPEVLILNFISEVKLDKYLELNGEKKYDLTCIIVLNERGSTYEFAIKNANDEWFYFSNGGSKNMIFEEIVKIRGIIMAFYCLNKNDFSIFQNKDYIN